MSAKASNTTELRTGEVLDTEEFRSVYLLLLRMAREHRKLFEDFCIMVRSSSTNSVTPPLCLNTRYFDHGLISKVEANGVALSEIAQRTILAMSKLNDENVEIISPIEGSTDEGQQ